VVSDSELLLPVALFSNEHKQNIMEVLKAKKQAQKEKVLDMANLVVFVAIMLFRYILPIAFGHVHSVS